LATNSVVGSPSLPSGSANLGENPARHAACRPDTWAAETAYPVAERLVESARTVYDPCPGNIVGSLLADLIAEGKSPLPLEPFQTDRFNEGAKP
jgi:hypothetical protein